MTEGIPTRLVEIRKGMGKSQRDMAKILSLSHRGWQVIEAGSSIPGGQTLARLVELGFDANWILTGHGSPQTVHSPASSKTSNAIVPSLLGNIIDAIVAVYKEMNAHLPPRDLGVLSAEKYSEIIEAADSPDEWPTMVKLMATQLRKELAAQVASANQAKGE